MIRKIAGNPLVVNMKPAEDMAAGDVLVVGNYPYVADAEYVSAVMYNVGLNYFGGEYETTDTDAAFAAGDEVYWNPSAKKLTKSVTGAVHFGRVITPCAKAGASCTVLLTPNGTKK